MDFRDKRVIISGAALGMGNLISRQFAAAGAKVLACDINGDAVETLAAEIRQSGGRAAAARVDVESYDSIQAAVDHAVREFGGVDILVNFAGGAATRTFQDFAPFWERKPRLLEWGVNVNLRGALYFARAVFPEMMKNPGGVIIGVGSIDSETGTNNVEYGCSKTGIKGLIKSLAVVGAPYNIRAVCVIPGPVLTRANMAEMPTLLGHAAEPDELTDFIMYMCSDRARSITGSSHLVDSGRSCCVPLYRGAGK
ncbi:MAG: SDR family oxidoreductase [Lentisphaeria bacterium]|nr:SDR family oxidoreductase [Lentisphaeria bacterium]